MSEGGAVGVNAGQPGAGQPCARWRQRQLHQLYQNPPSGPHRSSTSPNFCWNPEQ